MHHVCWSNACSSLETVSRDTVFCRCLHILSKRFCLFVCFPALPILISSYTFGNKEMSQAEFQEKSDCPKQATPRHKLLCNVNVLLTNPDHPYVGTLGAHLDRKMVSARAALLGKFVYFAKLGPETTKLSDVV